MLTDSVGATGAPYRHDASAFADQVHVARSRPRAESAVQSVPQRHEAVPERAPEQDAQADADAVRGLLSDQGTLGLDRNENMHEIASILRSGDPAHTDAVLANLSDTELKSLMENLEYKADVNTWPLEAPSPGGMLTGYLRDRLVEGILNRTGMQGLSRDERSALFQDLAGRVSGEQLARLVPAAATTGSAEQQHDVIALTKAAAQKLPGSEFATFAAQANADLPSWAGYDMWETLLQPGNAPSLSALDSRLSQFTNEDGSPMWRTPDEQRGLAIMLLQDPSLTPEKLKHDQQMSRLAIAAYSEYEGIATAGYEKVQDYSTETGLNASLYYNADSGEYALSFRGTDFFSAREWLGDGRQSLGLPYKQYEEAVNLAREVKGQYGDKLTDITGHSLGGGLTAVAGMATNTRTTAFDAAGVHSNTLDRLGLSSDDSMVTTYNVAGDTVTVLQENPLLPAPGAMGKQVITGAYDRDGNLMETQGPTAQLPGCMHEHNQAVRGVLDPAGDIEHFLPYCNS